MNAEKLHTYSQNKFRLLAINPNNIELYCYKNNDLFLCCNASMLYLIYTEISNQYFIHSVKSSPNSKKSIRLLC